LLSPELFGKPRQVVSIVKPYGPLGKTDVRRVFKPSRKKSQKGQGGASALWADMQDLGFFLRRLIAALSSKAIVRSQYSNIPEYGSKNISFFFFACFFIAYIILIGLNFEELTRKRKLHGYFPSSPICIASTEVEIKTKTPQARANLPGPFPKNLESLATLRHGF